MIRRSPGVMPRRVATAIAVALLSLLTACATLTGATAGERQAGNRSILSRSSTDDIPDRDAGSETGGGDDGPGATGQGGPMASLLPPAVSQVWEIGNRGLYVTAEDGRTEVVAFDLETGIELYRVDTHPAGALRGLAPSLFVDRELNVFLTPQVSERFGVLSAVLVAFDVGSGNRMWASEFPIGGTPLFECGSRQVCARGDDEQLRYSLSSGENVATIESNAGTVIASEGEHLIGIVRDDDNPDEFLGLAGFGGFGEQQRWSITADELADVIGLPLDPGWGWNADVDEVSGVAALTLANADPDLIGGAIGVDLVTGRTAWVRPGVSDCLYNYPSDRPVIKCVASGEAPALVDRIVRLDPSTGDELWSIAVADPFEPYDVEIVHGNDYLYVWIGGQVLVYDLDDGRPVVSEGPFLCANSVWTYDVDYYPDEDPWEYYADTLVVLCDADGFLLRPVDVAELLAGTDIAASQRVSFDWELRPFVLDAIPQVMIDGESGEA